MPLTKDFKGSVLIAALAVEAQKIRRFEKEYCIYVSQADKAQKYQQEWTETFTSIKRQLEGMLLDRSGMWSEQERGDFTQWSAGLLAYEEGFNKLVTHVKSGVIRDTFAANAAIGEAKDKFRILLDGTAKIGAVKLQSAQVAEAKIIASARFLVFVLVGTIGGSIIICLFLVIIVPRSITRPITMLSEAATAMSNGDLEQAIPANVGLQDFAGLAETLERMRISLKVMMHRLMGAAQN